MAATKTVLRVSNTRAVIRIVATTSGDTSTISLGTDLVGSGDALTAGGTPTAIVSKVKTSTANSITLARNGTTVGAFYGSDVIEESDWVIGDQATSDVVVTFVGGPGMIIIELAKVAGYSPKFESGSFGGGDNINAVGS